MQTEMTIKCVCERELILKMIGGQYQNSYLGDCECGRKWFLEDLTEDLVEELIENSDNMRVFQ